MQKILIISFDAVGNTEFDTLLQYPHFSRFAAQAATVRNVSSVFVTNTYPVHSSVITGVPQSQHGLIANVDPFPSRHPIWWADASRIKAKTLWQAARQKGMRTAAVMWPVTAGAKEIDYNIPEVLPRPGQSQISASLQAGSKLTQIAGFLRHRHLLKGIAQPQRDAFATACMVDILRRKKPQLALMHLTAYDTLCHHYGRHAPELDEAFASLDANLGRLLAAIDSDTSVLLFSDHSQINVHSSIAANELLVDIGLMRKDSEGLFVDNGGCFIECCGGCAFFHARGCTTEQTEQARVAIQNSEGFLRFLTESEMATCGRASLPFGFCSKPGYHYEAYPSDEKANHGYPLDYNDYQVFYMGWGAPFSHGKSLSGGSLLDIAPLATQLLQLDMPALSPARQDLFV